MRKRAESDRGRRRHRRPSSAVRRGFAVVVCTALVLAVVVAAALRRPRSALRPDDLPALRSGDLAARLANAAGTASPAELETLALRASSAHPDDPLAALVLGEALAARGAAAEARTAYARVLDLAPAWPAPIVALAADEIARGETRRALDRLDAAVRRTPRAPSLRRLRAHARRLVGDDVGSLDDLVAAGRLHPGIGRDLLEAGRRVAHGAWLRDGSAARDHPRARRWLEDAAATAARHPGDAAAAAVRATALLELDRPELALVALRTPRTRAPGSRAPGSAAAPPIGTAARRLVLRALALDGVGDAAGALNLLHGPHPHELVTALTDALDRATSPVAGRHAARLAALRRARPGATFGELREGQIVAALQAASAARATGDTTLAVAHLRTGPFDPRTLLAAARTLAAHAGRHAVDGHLAGVCLRHPRSPEPWYLRGVVARRDGDRTQAVRHLRSALERDPRFAPAANDLAWLLADDAAHLPEARRLAEVARAARPDDPVIAHTLHVLRTRTAQIAGQGEPR